MTALRIKIRGNPSIPIASLQLFQALATNPPPVTTKSLLTTLATWLVDAASTVSALRQPALSTLAKLAATTGSLSIALDLVAGLLAPPPRNGDPELVSASNGVASLSDADLIALAGSRKLVPASPLSDAALAPIVLNFLATTAGDARPTPGATEAPMCVEISRSMVNTCLRIMRSCMSQLSGNDAYNDVLTGLLRLLEQNFKFLQGSNVDPATIQLTGRGADGEDPMEALAGLLMSLVLAKTTGVTPAVSDAAASLMVSQLRLFMRVASGSTSVGVIDLYRIHIVSPLPASSSRVKLVEDCLKLVAQNAPGGDDSNDMLKVPAPAMSAEDYFASSSRAASLKVLETLLSVPPGATRRT